ncbi:MAG: hypothetical protein LWY06_12135 [Firmicutes bacterium]|nr:hypothetical protein [Bacillota bacterium]
MKNSPVRPKGQKYITTIVIAIVSLFLFMCSCANQESSSGVKEKVLKDTQNKTKVVMKSREKIDIEAKKAEIRKKIDEAMAKPQEENGWYNYEEASLSINLDGCANIVNLADEKVSEKNLELVKKLADQNEKAFAMVDKGFGKPGFQIPINYDEGSAARVPNFLKLRSLTSLLVVAGNYERYNGNYPQAAQRYIEALRLSQGVAKNGTLIFGMIGVALEKKALPALNELLREPGISKETCRYILQEVTKINSERVAFQDLMDCELLFVEITMDLIKDSKFQDMAELKMYSDPEVREKCLTRYEKWYCDITEYLQAEYPQAVANLETLVVTNDNSPENFFIPNTSKAYKQYTLSTARYQGVLAMAALQVYKMDNSGYPANLEKLTPSYLNTVPVDPFTGKGLSYSLKNNSFVLYSIGTDMKDDGSVPAIDSINTNGDLVFNSGIN